MSNLQKFNQTLEDFNQEVEQLKDVSGAFKKLQHLTETYNSIIKQLEENNKTLDKINESQKKQQEKLYKILADIENANIQNKSDLLKLVEEKTDQIRRENKDFYRDLEGTIKIKLNDNKSEIKNLIENEREKIKQILEIEFTKNNKELKQFIKSENKSIKISFWIIGGLTLVVSLIAMIKLWI